MTKKAELFLDRGKSFWLLELSALDLGTRVLCTGNSSATTVELVQPADIELG